MRGDLTGGRDGEAVDDPGAGRGTQVACQPGQTGGVILQLLDPQVQGGTVQAATQDQDGLVVGGRILSCAQLLSDVAGDALVGRGRGGQDGGVDRQIGQQGTDTSVVRAEVVAPVRDAVGLVDDDQAGVRGQVGQDLLAEDRVVEPLWGDQEDVDLAGGDTGLDLGPLRGVG